MQHVAAYEHDTHHERTAVVGMTGVKYGELPDAGAICCALHLQYPACAL